MGGHGKKARAAKTAPMYDELETLARDGRLEEMARRAVAIVEENHPRAVADPEADRKVRWARMRLEEWGAWIAADLLSKLDAAHLEIVQLRKRKPE